MPNGIETPKFDIIAPADGIEDNAGQHENRTAEPNNAPKPVDGIGTIDPFAVSGTPGSGTGNDGTGNQPRRRGRPPGSKNKSAGSGTETKATDSRNLSINLEELLLSIHCMGAAFLSSPELELDEAEAKKVAHHIEKVSALYNHHFDPRTLVWVAFFAMLAEVYGTRGVAIYRRVTEEKPATPGKPILVPHPDSPTPSSKIENPSQLWSNAPIEDNGE